MRQHSTGTDSTRARGYTLVEALVVIAIIGMISLIAVPNFIQMNRSGKVKSSLRNYTTNLRAARQRAVTSQNRSMISFDLGATDGTSYSIFTGVRQPDGTYDWTPIAPQPVSNLEPTVYFSSTDFTDAELSDGRLDVIFRENGEIFFPTGETPGFREVVLQGDPRAPNYRFRVTFSPSGQLRALAF